MQPHESYLIELQTQRNLLWTSMTADGMRETFVLDAEIFDVGQDRKRAKTSTCA